MLQWETIEQESATNIHRAKIYGGWLVMSTCDVNTQLNDVNYNIPTFRNEQGYEWRNSICFVPDRNHEWKL